MLPGRKKRIKVYLADDHPIFVEGISRVVDGDSDLTLVGSAGDGQTALEDILRLKPDVAVLDFSMPNLTGLEVLAQLRGKSDTRVLLLTGTEVKEAVFEAIQAGARAYLLKTMAWSDLTEAIKKVATGETVVAPSLIGALAGRIERHQNESLSRQERLVLNGLAQGKTVEAIALQMCIAPSTVKTYATRINRKLGTTNRTTAVAEALRRGLID